MHPFFTRLLQARMKCYPFHAVKSFTYPTTQEKKRKSLRFSSYFNFILPQIRWNMFYWSYNLLLCLFTFNTQLIFTWLKGVFVTTSVIQHRLLACHKINLGMKWTHSVSLYKKSVTGDMGLLPKSGHNTKHSHICAFTEPLEMPLLGESCQKGQNGSLCWRRLA